MDAAVIESEALKLPEMERAILVDHLQSSLSHAEIPHLDAHLRESQDRFEAYQNGEIEDFDGHSLVSSLRSKLSL